MLRQCTACPKARASFSPRSFPLASVAFGYLPILLFLIVALGLSAGFVVLPMLVARLTGAHKPDPQKLSEYECGFPAFDDARAEFAWVAAVKRSFQAAEAHRRGAAQLVSGRCQP